MMHIWSCDRRRFVDFLANQKPLRSSEVQIVDTIEGIAPGSEEDILLVWQESPADTFSLPHAAIVAEGNSQDFLAWVLTYFRQFRPFTAHCRLLTPSLARQAVEPGSSDFTQELRTADIGLILAEGIAYSTGRIDPNRLPLSAYSRTLSHALAEGTRRYGQSPINMGATLDHIKNGWTLARDLSNQPPLDLPASFIRDVWSVVLSSTVKNSLMHTGSISELLLVEALQGIRENGKVPSETWTRFDVNISNLDLLIDELEGPREGRVKAVDNALRDLALGSDSTRKHRAFIAGYITSRIQPGSLDHFPVLTPVTTNLRESYLWYGVCAGLSPESSVNNFGNGIGWLLRRELERSSRLLDRPNCDIALSEMELLLKNRDGMKGNLRPLISGSLKIEIFPLICTTVKWNDAAENYINEKIAHSEHQKSLFIEDSHQLNQDVLDLLRKVEESSIALNSIRKTVETKFGVKTLKNNNKRK